MSVPDLVYARATPRMMLADGVSETNRWQSRLASRLAVDGCAAR